MSDPFGRHRVEPVQVPASEQPVSADPQKPLDGQPNSAATSNPFSHHKELEPERTREPLSAQELLHWLQHNWGKPTISLRDIQKQGPRPIRDRRSAATYAENLEKQGWLIELKAFRRDRRVWRLSPAMVTS
jgi:hypothetical protein